jgi:type I restriction enzyme S subunit
MTRPSAIVSELKSTLTPKLRFPEFRDGSEWDAELGDEVFDQISNREAPAGLPILAITQEHGAIPRDEIDYHVSVTDKSLETYKEVCPGDFIISLRSFQGGIEYSRYHGICSPAYVILRKKGELSEAFFKHLFKSYSFIQQLTKNLEGLRDGKMISYKQFSEMLLPYPEPAEQQKIAECVSTLDELIGAECEKLEVLKAHKTGLMQQLFPCEGETLPRLRFPEFRKAPPWKLKKIGSMLIETPRPVEMDDETEYSLVTVKRRYGGVVSRGILHGREILVKSQFLVKQNDFLISKRQIVHNACGLVPSELDRAIVSNEYSVLGPRDGCDILFFDYFAQQPRISESFLQCSVGIVIEKMLFKLDRWLRLEFPFPSFDEQHRIATCLSLLDDLIAAQSDKLDALQIHKQGLMQQLFPSPAKSNA